MSYQNKDHIYVKEKAVDSLFCDAAIHWLDNKPLWTNPHGYYTVDTHHIDDTEFGFILDIVHENSINQDNHIMLSTWSMEMMN